MTIEEFHKKVVDMWEKLLKEWETYWSEDPERTVEDVLRISENQVSIYNYRNKFWLDVPFSTQAHKYYCRINDKEYVAYFEDWDAAKKEWKGRSVSWSHDWKQPKDEWLYVISYSTGAYIFNQDYPQNTFRQYWEELVALWPKYIDDQNHSIYFDVEKMSDVQEKKNKLFKEYKLIAREEWIIKKVGKLEKQISQLKWLRK